MLVDDVTMCRTLELTADGFWESGENRVGFGLSGSMFMVRFLRSFCGRFGSLKKIVLVIGEGGLFGGFGLRS